MRNQPCVHASIVDRTPRISCFAIIQPTSSSAAPTPAEWAETLKVAREIVEAVCNDEEEPELAGGRFTRGELLVFRLAQDLIHSTEQLKSLADVARIERLE